MGVGVSLKEINCDLESASGRWARRRKRQRRRGSDELALFAVTHDLATGRRLSYFKFVRGNVDTGDTYRPEQSFLAPADSTDQIVLSLAAREIDGAGSLAKLADRKFAYWVDTTSQLGPVKLPGGNPTENAADVAADVVASILSTGFHWLAGEQGDDIIAVDRFIVSSSPGGAPPSASTPEEESEIALSNDKITLNRSIEVVDDNTVVTTTYDSSDANSRYTFSFEFRN